MLITLESITHQFPLRHVNHSNRLILGWSLCTPGEQTYATANIFSHGYYLIRWQFIYSPRDLSNNCTSRSQNVILALFCGIWVRYAKTGNWEKRKLKPNPLLWQIISFLLVPFKSEKTDISCWLIGGNTINEWHLPTDSVGALSTSYVNGKSTTSFAN